MTGSRAIQASCGTTTSCLPSKRACSTSRTRLGSSIVPASVMGLHRMRSDLQRQKAREYRAVRKEHYAQLNRDWIKNNRAKYNASKAKYRIKLKREVMSLYADPVACIQCGFSRLDGLVLDHIHDNGSAHRKASNISHRGFGSGTRIYEHIRKIGKIDGLQVLCANCNTIKQLKSGRSKTIKDSALLAEIDDYADQAPRP